MLRVQKPAEMITALLSVMLSEQKQSWLAEVIARTSKEHKRSSSLLSQELEALPS